MIKITPHIYRIGGVWGAGVFSTNIYLLLDNGVTIVDTGYKGRVAQVCREIKRLGYTPSDVENIIVTHHHVDHTGSLSSLKEMTGARIIAHADDAPYIEGKLPQPCPAALAHVEFLESLWTARPVNVDVMVGDGDILPLLGGIRVIHTPGHTPGSICLSIPQNGVLIAGDVIANTLGLRLPPKAFTADLAQEIRSIRKIAGLDFNIICFGHGSPVLNAAREAVAGFAARLEEKYSNIQIYSEDK
jgi:glyoxylase-like metal-dependent hydrolase (beta-lactamase superfamily II)